jgi:glycosyltransferase involved in cell wall biosynthesis
MGSCSGCPGGWRHDSCSLAADPARRIHAEPRTRRLLPAGSRSKGGLNAVRVLYVWDADYPWDVRTEKVCLALVEGGHRVVIAARNLRASPRTETRPEGIVERLPAGPAPGRRLLSFPAFFNPLWLGHLIRLVHRHSIDLIMVRDLPLAPTALLASRGRRPVILDMAENYPAMIRDIWTDRRQRPFDILVRNPALVAHLERMVIGRVSHVLTVVEESSDRLVELGIPRERTSVVSNTPPKARVSAPLPRVVGEPLRIIYLGLMEKHRGIASVLDASARLKQSCVPFHLDMVGDGRDYDHFQGYAATLGLPAEIVTFHGRLPHADAIRLVAQAHVGLVPHEARESWNTTIPNKLFDYMAAGLAVVSSDAAPAARVVNETGAGLVFRSGDGDALAEKIRQCLNVPAWEQYRQAGQSAIQSRYNWEADTQVLLNVVSRVGSEGGPMQRPADGSRAPITEHPDRGPQRI